MVLVNSFLNIRFVSYDELDPMFKIIIVVLNCITLYLMNKTNQIKINVNNTCSFQSALWKNKLKIKILYLLEQCTTTI